MEHYSVKLALQGMGIVLLSAFYLNASAAYYLQLGAFKNKSYAQELSSQAQSKLNLKVGEISSKYDRGIHTTRFSIMLLLKDGTKVIDTPGIRECWIYDLDPEQLKFYFPEFVKASEKCAYYSCLHIDEPDCRIKELVETGEIHKDRYFSYTRILNSLKERENYG